MQTLLEIIEGIWWLAVNLFLLWWLSGFTGVC